MGSTPVGYLYTPQQLAGGGRYGPKTKIGNWSEDLSLEEVKLDSNLRYDLDLTSLDAMNVIMALEDEFGQEAGIEQILELQTVQQLVDYLLSLLQQPK